MKLLARVSLAAALAASPTLAFSFPDLIRKGYQTCFGCHVSPAGGGAINDYGRLVSVELATWGGEDEAKNIWGAANATDGLTGALAKGLTVRAHGDVRYLKYKVASDEFSLEQKFIMQQEMEFVLDYKNTVGLAYSIGKYEGTEETQARKAYVYANAGDKVRVRFGRFMPAFGLVMDDHTLYTRKALGFNQGLETVNAELSLYFKWIELFITERLGREPRFIFDVEQGVRALDDERNPNDIDRATLVRLSVYPTGKLTLGASMLKPRNNNTEEPLKYGVFGQWAFSKRMYVMTEIDLMHRDDSKTFVGFGRLGLEVFKGMIFRADYEQLKAPTEAKNQVAGSLQWIPRPHFEIQLEASQTNVKERSPARAYQVVYHLWL